MNVHLRTLTLLFALLFLFVSAFGQKAPTKPGAKTGASEIAGRWDGGVSAGGAAMRITLELKTEGSKVVGQISSPHGNWAVTDVKFAEGKWAIAWRTPEGATGKMTGTVTGEKMTGDWDFSPAFVGTFELTRATSAAK